MFEALTTFGGLVLLFFATVGITYLVARFFRPKPTPMPRIAPNVSVRLVGPGGVYRSHYLGVEPRGLVFSSPLQRDHFVPFRVGDSMTIQIPSGNGVLTFRTSIVHRDPSCHEFVVATPIRFRFAERRTEPRDQSVEGRRVIVNGAIAELRDISANGAKLVTTQSFKSGEEVELDFGRGDEAIRGWTLDSTPSTMDARPARAIRIRFEAPLSGLSSSEM